MGAAKDAMLDGLVHQCSECGWERGEGHDEWCPEGPAMVRDDLAQALGTVERLYAARARPGDLRRPGDGEMLDAVARAVWTLGRYVLKEGEDADAP